MIQRLVISLIHIITNTFFRRIEVVGIEHVPDHGPVIFAGNHPNAFMDGWLITATCGRWPLHFMANAKLWKYRSLTPMLNAMGAVPVYRHEEHGGTVDNSQAFQKLYEVIESQNCMGIFPEGVSHAEAQMAKLKTGAARVALEVGARGNTHVPIVVCGLNYIHRHRFRSQVYIEYGEPIDVGDQWIREYEVDKEAAVRKLTDQLSKSLGDVTLNAPDWRTLRFIQTARRLYKPRTADLSPRQYVRLSRRFVDSYVKTIDNPDMQKFRDDVENYQSRLDMLGLKDYQLRSKVTPGQAIRKMLRRSLKMLLLLPLAIPGALLHLPVGWIAAMVGERFSYEMDDIATLKVLSTILLLPLLYLTIAIVVGLAYGWIWSLLTIVTLGGSFFVSVRLIEAQATLFNSIISLTKLTRRGDDVEDLQATRASLVTAVRDLAERYSDPEKSRLFTQRDFEKQDDD